jgi:hypothetical protein
MLPCFAGGGTADPPGHTGPRTVGRAAGKIDLFQSYTHPPEYTLARTHTHTDGARVQSSLHSRDFLPVEDTFDMILHSDITL